jgi:hypothetical protein
LNLRTLSSEREEKFATLTFAPEREVFSPRFHLKVKVYICITPAVMSGVNDADAGLLLDDSSNPEYSLSKASSDYRGDGEVKKLRSENASLRETVATMGKQLDGVGAEIAQLESHYSSLSDDSLADASVEGGVVGVEEDFDPQTEYLQLIVKKLDALMTSASSSSPPPSSSTLYSSFSEDAGSSSSSSPATLKQSLAHTHAHSHSNNPSSSSSAPPAVPDNDALLVELEGLKTLVQGVMETQSKQTHELAPFHDEISSGLGVLRKQLRYKVCSV